MASKELLEQIEVVLEAADIAGDSYDLTADNIIKTILAALQEPTVEMLEMCDREDAMKSSYVTYSDYWRVMLNASPLGEQSE